MTDAIMEYKEKLEKGITEYMTMPISERSATAVCGMLTCLEKVNHFVKDHNKKEDTPLTKEEYSEWLESMKNEDGSIGAHWTKAESNTFPHNSSEDCWNAIMNMMYSDYFEVAMKYGVNYPEFYADLAEAFITDKDAGENKVENYYRHVIKE